MPKEFSRTERFASNLQRVLAQLINREIKDPKITGLITVNDVAVSKDLGHAKVYVSILNADNIDEVIERLNAASGFLHNLMGKELSSRVVPKLKFYQDTLLADANRMEKLIDQVMQEDEKNQDDST